VFFAIAYPFALKRASIFGIAQHAGQGRRITTGPDLGLRSLPEIANLRVERSFEGAALDIGSEALCHL
jgi:hypothetical protein